jgi:hypothetical protein
MNQHSEPLVPRRAGSAVALALETKENLLEPREVRRAGASACEGLALAVLKLDEVRDAGPRRPATERIRERRDVLFLLLPAPRQQRINVLKGREPNKARPQKERAK